MTGPANYIGRFAPSPTGDLHFGSLITAVASFLQARSNSGKWLIRIEDIDPLREIPGSADRILQDLKFLGMVPDEPVLYQSTQIKPHRLALDSLLEKNNAYACNCSRKALADSRVYPGICRQKSADLGLPHSFRVKTSDKDIQFTDRLQGPTSENLSLDRGDFVVWRADALPAYQLAVVVDDAMQEITEVVRGADLLGSTCRQIHLQALLELPTPRYIHLPVATKGNVKLGKRYSSDPIIQEDPVQSLSDALDFLGHKPPAGMKLEGIWNWAIEHWSIDNIPSVEEIPIDDVSGR